MSVYAFLFALIRATCPACLIFLDAINIILSGDECKLWTSLSCSLLHILFQIFASNASHLRSYLLRRRSSSSPVQSCRRSYNNVYCNFKVVRPRSGRQKFQNWKVTSSARIQTVFNFLMNHILICCCLSKLFEHCHMFCTPIAAFTLWLMLFIVSTWRDIAWDHCISHERNNYAFA
jgi:hypothetical protein